MTYTLFVGNKRYSSWSMRAWVLLKALDISFDEKVQLFKPGLRQPEFLAFSPSGKVPCLHDGATSTVVWDSLAICEYVAESHAGAWPVDAGARAFARSAAAEMHSGFPAIRDECSMNVGLRIELVTRSEALQRDISRFNELFTEGLDRFGGPWLAGKEFTIVDAMYAPIASRCKTYGIELEGAAQEYLDRLLEHPAVQEWVQGGIKETEREPLHEEDCVRGRRILEDLTKASRIDKVDHVKPRDDPRYDPLNASVPCKSNLQFHAGGRTGLLARGPTTPGFSNVSGRGSRLAPPTTNCTISDNVTMTGQGIRQYLGDVSPYLLLLIAVSTLGSLQFGYHLGELNAPQDVITCHKKSISVLLRVREMVTSSRPSDEPSGFLPDCIPMTEAAFATVSSIFTLGGLVGALCAGPVSSSRGRLLAMRVTAFLYLVGASIETISGSVFVMALGRLVSGIGAGASTVVVPLYISEIAPPKARGLFGSMTQISINVGILAAQTLGFFLSYGSAWRWILGFGVCFAASNALGLLAVPESPSWLAAHGHVTEAKRTLQRIRGSGHDISEEIETWNPDEQGTSEEEGLLQADPLAEPTQPPVLAKSASHLGFFDVVKDPLTRPAIVAVVGIMFVQQLCGINSVIMYSVSLFADLLPVSSGLLAILISVVNLVTTVACSPLPDRLGRKTCLLISVIGQGSSALALALSVVFGFKILSAVAVLFFVGFYAVGLGPVPFILASELVGQEAVGATQSWCLGANYVASFIVAQFFPIVNKALNNLLRGHGWVYFIFAGLAAGSVVFVYWNVPESKGKRDADEVWGRTRRAD
ncbi:hypothetical protein G7Z17_g12375 [Cylindrodendrum hubeiense]|uniref:Major facilitator superfamily (MFS) profile domain-containing protein n=1 Tax=Cylindrodendrum hubeiense TaxID=595255 RepID=A0A9P5H116_9HYPO|nr:hypothetical protein G7Z17_g12375 [Cylindrodendrum hubeiense]